MNMVVYMIDTEAVVTIALGTVTKLEFGIICVCFAAYGAFMPVRLVGKLAFCLFSGFLEVDHLRRGLYFKRLYQ